MPGPAGDEEFLLEAGPWRAVVGAFGASLRRLWIDAPGATPRDLVWGYEGKARKRGGQGDVLVPFPGRISGGQYTFDGATHHLDRNDKDGPNAIHGFVRGKVWESHHDGATAAFRTQIRAGDHPGYPFELEIGVGYELLPTGLACAFAVRNVGQSDAPAGAGFHPYIQTRWEVDKAQLGLPASQVLESKDLIPTGLVREVTPDFDFQEARSIGNLRLNHCFTGLRRDAHGFALVRVDDVEVWMDRHFSHVVLYTGDALGTDARRSLAVEPMTCATDAFNHGGWGARRLAPGEVMTGTWGIRLAT